MATDNVLKHLIMAQKELHSVVTDQGVRLGQQERETQRLNQAVEDMKKVNESQGKEIAELQKKNREQRNETIRMKVAMGIPSKEVAKQHNMSVSNVSNIAPKNKYQPQNH
ncbi:hypothetical protein ACNO5E_21310 [Vibrio parahaemolyticus]|uniref:hypothetical protein n=1 Tax=Vibrio parahaemolyticus TaxID=670 RepID=UPI0008133050|nr:hypothetical protein [Vibrio parahaemolyticus]OCP68371.1 hypothetical protein AKH08_16285 [Vibrio parahaemolyticus]